MSGGQSHLDTWDPKEGVEIAGTDQADQDQPDGKESREAFLLYYASPIPHGPLFPTR